MIGRSGAGPYTTQRRRTGVIARLLLDSSIAQHIGRQPVESCPEVQRTGTNRQAEVAGSRSTPTVSTHILSSSTSTSHSRTGVNVLFASQKFNSLLRPVSFDRILQEEGRPTFQIGIGKLGLYLGEFSLPFGSWVPFSGFFAAHCCYATVVQALVFDNLLASADEKIMCSAEQKITCSLEHTYRGRCWRFVPTWQIYWVGRRRQ